MLGQLSRQEQPDSSLDFPGGDGFPLVVVGQPAGFSSNPSEQVIDKRVHDAHGFGGDTGVRMDLLQHLVDVCGIGLRTTLPLLARHSSSSTLPGRIINLRNGFLTKSLRIRLGWHVDGYNDEQQLMQ